MGETSSPLYARFVLVSAYFGGRKTDVHGQNRLIEDNFDEAT